MKLSFIGKWLAKGIQQVIAALPSSSFERTMLEEDERFYATFPQARQAAINAWIAHEFPYAHWAQSSSATDEDMSTGVIFGDLPTAPMSTSVHSPVPDFSTFTLAHALALSPSCRLEIPAHRPLTIIYDASTKLPERNLNPDSTEHIATDRVGSPQGWDLNQQSPVSEIVPESCSMTTSSKQESVLLALQVLAPARRRRSTRNTLKIRARPPPYTPSTPKRQENAYPSTFFATPPESTSARACITAPPPFKQYTGDWKAGAITAAEHLHTPERIRTTEKQPVSLLPRSKKSDDDTSSTRSQSPLPCKARLLSRSRQRSDTPSKQPARASSERPSPLAPRKRTKLLRDKDGKPLMACLFCRGRKIACGPPPQGSDDPTCNQCARRGLACRYPTESRRGQRKKKTDFVNAQYNDISKLLDLYRNATLKDNVLHDIHYDSDSE
ncbi:hypothetical protein C0992_012306 [Termitomyces sp. T32_za158]|nr:hypothetical protein C0992_012306 [Termitomyces sp. T32_za158]